MNSTCALKEWNVAIEALEAGKTIVLLRKGGISEDNRHFQVQKTCFWLYPTYEHQKPELLKPEYADRVTTVESGWHPESVRIGSRAEIAAVLTATDEQTVEKLLPYHIWSDRLALERLRWKANQALSILLLRVYRLPEPQIIPYQSSYGGCKSWIDLADIMPDREMIPVIDDRIFAEKIAEIRSIIDDRSRFGQNR
jgi:hypothetical protein